MRLYIAAFSLLFLLGSTAEAGQYNRLKNRINKVRVELGHLKTEVDHAHHRIDYLSEGVVEKVKLFEANLEILFQDVEALKQAVETQTMPQRQLLEQTLTMDLARLEDNPGQESVIEELNVQCPAGYHIVLFDVKDFLVFVTRTGELDHGAPLFYPSVNVDTDASPDPLYPTVLRVALMSQVRSSKIWNRQASLTVRVWCEETPSN